MHGTHQGVSGTAWFRPSASGSPPAPKGWGKQRRNGSYKLSLSQAFEARRVIELAAILGDTSVGLLGRDEDVTVALWFERDGRLPTKVAVRGNDPMLKRLTEVWAEVSVPDDDGPLRGTDTVRVLATARGVEKPVLVDSIRTRDAALRQVRLTSAFNQNAAGSSSMEVEMLAGEGIAGIVITHDILTTLSRHGCDLIISGRAIATDD
jgi:hypothetical protein